MNLTILGVIGITILLLMLSSVIYKNLTIKSLFFLFSPFLFTICIYGYTLQPVKADDLYRYYIEMSRYMNQNIAEFYFSSTWNSTILSSGFMFVISKSREIHIFGGLLSLLYFLVFIFSVMFLGNGKKNVLGVLLLFLVFFSNIYLYEFISVSRFSLGLFYTTIIVYFDFFKFRKRAFILPLYFIGFLIHTSLIVIFGIKLILVIKNQIFRYVLLLFSPVLVSGLSILMEVSKVPFLQDLAIKINTTSSNSMLFTSWIRVFIYISILFLIFILIILDKKNNGIISSRTNIIRQRYKYNQFLLALFIFLVTTPFWMQLAFHRFIQLLIILSLPLLYQYIYSNGSRLYKYIIILAFAAVSLSNIIYQVILYM